MSLYQKFIQNERLRRFCVLALIIFVLYLSRSMITTILLTFIFTYLAAVPFCSTLYENPDDCHRSLNLCIGCFSNLFSDY